MSALIEVLAIRPLDGKTSVKAFVDVRLGGVTIRGAKIVQQEAQRPWIAMPAIKCERTWSNVVELSRALRERVTDAVLQAWQWRSTPAAAPDEPFYDDSAEAIRDLEGRR
jgi:DNA-binding cell septation regulator SpoVG